MKITDILNIESTAIDIKVESKSDLLDKMIELAAKSDKIKNLDEARREIFEREKILSTGVGKGIALPHAKTDAITEITCSVAVLNPPVDYESLDGNPVDICFLLLGRENDVGNHLRLLSKISRYLNQAAFRSKLKECINPQQIIDLFAESDTDD